ncbi:MAG: hypothetical protein V4687_00750 [Bacteroidota bacterium]
MSKIIILAILAVIYFCLASCSKRQALEMKPDEVVVPENPGTTITYTNFVQGLFQSKCSVCHATGGSASAFWTFNGFGSVSAKSASIKQLVLVSKTMPKGGSLSATELSSLQTWFDNGLPQ